jgi:hypothetical protein
MSISASITEFSCAFQILIPKTVPFGGLEPTRPIAHSQGLTNGVRTTILADLRPTQDVTGTVVLRFNTRSKSLANVERRKRWPSIPPTRTGVSITKKDVNSLIRRGTKTRAGHQDRAARNGAKT